ncbi:MAG: PilN domain-containing protein [Planctomycetes bacterium]|nr:PilN domain-containing protein [Planctomycetota bacterium]
MTSTRPKDRRQHDERRLGGERRRQSEGRCAIFEVCRSMLHLALVVRGGGSDGSDKVLTRSIRWRKEASSLHTERGVQGLSEAFRTLVADERLAGACARIALGGEFCVTRVITGPTEEVRREFAELEERSMRYLTLGPGPKTLAGDMQQLDARHQHALLAVANQRTLDLLMSIADSHSLQIESIEPSLLALSRAQDHLRDACREASLLIQLDENVAELGICHGGRLLLDYRPGGHTNAENVADVVALHLSRLQRYLERYHSYLDAPLRNVYLAGDAQAVASAAARFETIGGFKIRVIEPGDLDMPWQLAAQSPGTDLAATLGTALAIYSDAASQHGPNLMENALAGQRVPLRPILVRSLMPIAAVLLVAVALGLVRMNQWRQMASLRSELEALMPACVRATELRLKIIAAEAKLHELNALATQLPKPDWQQVLSRISQSMPEDVWLDRLSVYDSHSAALHGASYTDSGVYDFVGYLKQVPRFAEIALEGTGVGQSPTGPTTNFDLKLSLTNFAAPADKEDRHD